MDSWPRIRSSSAGIEKLAKHNERKAALEPASGTGQGPQMATHRCNVGKDEP